MSFTAPNFNLVMDFWQQPATPAGGAATLVALPTQLYIASRGFLDIQPNSPTLWVPPVMIRVPDATFSLIIAGGAQKNSIFGYGDVDGLTWYYKIRWWERMHAEFPNAYVMFICEQCTNAGVCPDPAR